MSYKQWTASVAPKVDGAWNLHYALDGNPLDFFVLVGSNSAVTGNAGQPNYAAANSFLEGIARYRRNRGLLAPPSILGQWQTSDCFLPDKDLLEGIVLSIHQSSVNHLSDPSNFGPTIGMSHTKPSSDLTFHAMWMNEARFTLYYILEVQGVLQIIASNDPLKDLADHIGVNPAILDDPETERILIKDLGAHIRGLMAALADMDDEHTANLVIDSLMAIEVKSSVRCYRRVDIGLAEINKAGTVRGHAKVVMAHWKAKYQKGEEEQQENAVDGAEVQP